MVKNKVIAIVQCRLGSLRFPNKALIKIGNKTVLSFLRIQLILLGIDWPYDLALLQIYLMSREGYA